MEEAEIAPQVVLMCGISGSGKTTYARRLEDKGYRRLSVDRIIWAQHGGTFVELPAERRYEIFAQANKELMLTFERALAQGQKVVVDTTLCSRSKRDAMRRLCHSFRVEPQLVYLRAGRDVLSRRLSTRRGAGPDDLIVPDDQLASFCRNFEVPDADEHPLIIDQR